MKTRFGLILDLVVAAVLMAGAIANAQDSPVTLKINPSHDGVIADGGVQKFSAPIYLVAELENRSSSVLSSSQWDYEEYYTFEVLDEQGRPVPEKERMRNLRDSLKPGGRRSGHGLISEIKPGERWKEQLIFSEYYDTSRPGTYTVQLERKLPEELGKGTVKSNSITITVLPPDPPVEEPK